MHIKAEKIAIWFFNWEEPAMGIENAKKFAFDKIVNLRERIIKNEITFKQAGELVKNDITLAEIDPQYKSNGYNDDVIIYYENQDEIKDRSEIETVFDLDPGEVSDILVGKNIAENNGEYFDAIFYIIKVNEKKGSYLNIDDYYRSMYKIYNIFLA